MTDESRDDDLQSLFQRNQPDRTSVDVQQIVVRGAVESSNSSRHKMNPHQRIFLMTIRAVALVAVAGSLVYFLVGLFVSTESIAFAEVKAQVERVRTVEYVETSYSGGKPDSDATRSAGEMTVAETIALLEKGLEDAKTDLVEDIKFQLSVFKGFPKKGPTILYVRRVRIKGKHLERSDQLFPCAATADYTSPPYSVRNARNGLTVSFIPAEKKRRVLKQQVVINPKTGEQSTSNIKKIPATVDIFARFRQIPAEATKRLPKRMIGGCEVIGFRSVEKHGDETWTRTHWVSPESKLPVEIVTELRKEKTLLQRWVHNRFTFDQEIPDGLFSTETPEDYQSEDGKVYGFGP